MIPSSFAKHNEGNNMFYVSILEPWTGREDSAQVKCILVADEAREWEVKEILRTVKVKKKLIYVIKWKGWLEEYVTYKPYAIVKDYEALDVFKAKGNRKTSVVKTK